MLEYINQNDYKQIMGTTSVPNNFNRLVKEASAYINNQTFNRIDSSNVCNEVKMCTCLIINLLEETEKVLSQVVGVKSENVDGWSRTYTTTNEAITECDLKKYEVLKTYLSNIIGTDGNLLLYRGC